MPADITAKSYQEVLKEATLLFLNCLRSGTRFPTDEELKAQFGDVEINRQSIMVQLENILGTQAVESVNDPEKIQEAIKKVEGENHLESQVPHLTPFAHDKRIGALGVLAELEEIEPLLKHHTEIIKPELNGALQEKIVALLPTIGVTNLNHEELLKVATEISQESAREIFENLATIQDAAQINQVVADSVTQTILVHPQTQQVKIPEEKLYDMIEKETTVVATNPSLNLEQVAVLGNLEKVAKLSAPNSQIPEKIELAVEEVIQSQAPLTTQTRQVDLELDLGTYLGNYQAQIASSTKPSIESRNLPNLEQLARIKEVAHNRAIARTATAGARAPSTLPFKEIAGELAKDLGLKPLAPDEISALGLTGIRPKNLTFVSGIKNAVAGARLGTENGQKEATYALLTFNQQRFRTNLEKAEREVKSLETRPSLSLRDRKKLNLARKNLTTLKEAQKLSLKRPKITAIFRSWARGLPNHRTLVQSSAAMWYSYRAIFRQSPGIFVPVSLSTQASPKRMFTSLVYSLGTSYSGLDQAKSIFHTGKGIVSTAKSITKIAKLGRLAFAANPLGLALLAAPKLINLIKKAAMVAGALLAGLLISMGIKALGLLAGIAAGATIGATVGFFVGGIPGALIGGAIGGTIGAAIGFLNPGKTLAFVARPWAPITSAINGIGGSIGGLFSSIGSGITGASSAVWGGFAGAASGLFGGLSAGASSLLAGSLSVSSPFLAISVFGGLGAIGIGGILMGIVTSTAFSSNNSYIKGPIAGDNTFFTLTKTAQPDVISNQPPGQTQQITFTITLTAKEVKLNNIQNLDETKVLGKAIAPTNPQVACPDTLAPNESCTAQITIGVNESYNDSVILNTIKVTAVPEGGDPIADFATTVVRVGSPAAINCFTFQGPWTDSEKALEMEAITALSRAPAYLNLVCSQGTVILHRDHSDGFNFVTCPNHIAISNLGVGNPDNTLYVLAHESGHIVQCYGLQAYQNFLNESPWTEGYICSYPAQKSQAEDFAEAIAIHVVWKTHNSRTCGPINYPSTYPKHYNFTHSLMGGVEF
ncbi:MAG: hypothetical protein NUV69_03385 [Candidatus Curtissbacteria bacterium]|nr:hypothetical protein [Candidatus Curtissbacteria bacterium]